MQIMLVLEGNNMKPVIRILLIALACLIVASALSSLIGAVLDATFGIIGTVLSFVWRVIFSPAILVIAIVWIVYRLGKRKKMK